MWSIKGDHCKYLFSLDVDFYQVCHCISETITLVEDNDHYNEDFYAQLNGSGKGESAGIVHLKC
jgi:hypothetical protein